MRHEFGRNTNNGNNTDGHAANFEECKRRFEKLNDVRLPEGEDPNEWLAMNTFDFFGQVGMMYGTIAEYCTNDSCPTMSAGPSTEYQWIDVDGAPIKYNARQYVNHLMNWVEQCLNDERLFPTKCESSFPDNFYRECKIIFKRLFRVYAHVYHNHIDQVKSYGGDAHMNTSFRQFIYFIKEFRLVEDRELEPLMDHIKKLCPLKYNI